jgi:methylase of polypeptide subunit release factors
MSTADNKTIEAAAAGTPADQAAWPLLVWTDDTGEHTLRWRSENGTAPPRRVMIADDTMPADTAYRLAAEGVGLLWRGDFQNARHLLIALARRADRKPEKGRKANQAKRAASAAKQAEAREYAATPQGRREQFHRHRMARAQRAHTLGMLLIPFEAGHTIPLRRAPDVQAACSEAYGEASEPYAISLRELLGLIGAHEWRRNGVQVAALEATIHPHYGVFAPLRPDYIELVAQAPLAEPAPSLAFDIGTGTGVLAALLAKRGIERVIATDRDPRALACARENIDTLGLSRRVQIVDADLFPPGRAPLIVCNPPWLPGKPSSALEHAVYDPDARMLRGFIDGLAAHLAPGGEGWLVLSDFAEHLGLRSRAELEAMFSAAGLKVEGRLEVEPTHGKARDWSDPLHEARAAEIVSLWRLRAALA